MPCRSVLMQGEVQAGDPRARSPLGLGMRRAALRSAAAASVAAVLLLGASVTAFRPPAVARRQAIRPAAAAASAADAASPAAAAPDSTVIIGSGPTGLFTSIMLARRGWSNIKVFDRLERPAPPDSPLWGDPYRYAQLLDYESCCEFGRVV